MKITRVRYAAARTVPHPFRQYHNLRPEVEFVATLENGDDPDAVAVDLRKRAEAFIAVTVKTMIEHLKKDTTE
jgi:hypothetical protein